MTGFKQGAVTISSNLDCAIVNLYDVGWVSISLILHREVSLLPPAASFSQQTCLYRVSTLCRPCVTNGMRQGTGQVLAFLDLTSQWGSQPGKHACQGGDQQNDKEESDTEGCLWTGLAAWASEERTLELRPEE